MKTKIFFAVLLLVPFIVMGQAASTEPSGVKVTPPVFRGIQNVTDVSDNVGHSIETYISKNFRYPEKAAKYCQQGTGKVRFVVKPNGELAGFQVINSVCPEIDNEFIRVLKTTSGSWQPGYKYGEPVEMPKEVSMIFFANGEWYQDPIDYFLRLARLELKKGNHLFLIKGKPEKALKHYDNSIKFVPNEASSLMTRGLCRYELGDYEGACSDWNRVNSIGKYDAEEYIDNLCGLKGLEVMKSIVNK